ncbi:MAG: acylneuraminate cytidylyltransferase family protein [Bacteroidota bacterium]
MKTLFVIPARGGSKGVIKKNSKVLGNKPLIAYSIELARLFANDIDICVSTDDEEIIELVSNTYKLNIPFKRPIELATDTSSTYDVLLHAVDYYLKQGIKYDALVLLQPTSPFRTKKNIEDALNLFSVNNIDMVVSVKESKANPYFNLFEENNDGFLTKSKESNYTRRQDCPSVFEYNGAVYVIKIESLLQKNIGQFKLVKKIVMTEEESLDIDTPLDWQFAEFFIAQKNGL